MALIPPLLMLEFPLLRHLRRYRLHHPINQPHPMLPGLLLSISASTRWNSHRSQVRYTVLFTAILSSTERRAIVEALSILLEFYSAQDLQTVPYLSPLVAVGVIISFVRHPYIRICNRLPPLWHPHASNSTSPFLNSLRLQIT